MTRVRFGHDRVGISPDELCTRREHPGAVKIQTSARNQACDDAAGARFAHRVPCNDDVGKFFGLHEDKSSAAQLIKPHQRRQIEVAKTPRKLAVGASLRQLGFCAGDEHNPFAATANFRRMKSVIAQRPQDFALLRSHNP